VLASASNPFAHGMHSILMDIVQTAGPSSTQMELLENHENRARDLDCRPRLPWYMVHLGREDVLL